MTLLNPVCGMTYVIRALSGKVRVYLLHLEFAQIAYGTQCESSLQWLFSMFSEKQVLFHRNKRITGTQSIITDTQIRSPLHCSSSSSSSTSGGGMYIYVCTFPFAFSYISVRVLAPCFLGYCTMSVYSSWCPEQRVFGLWLPVVLLIRNSLPLSVRHLSSLSSLIGNNSPAHVRHCGSLLQFKTIPSKVLNV